MVKKCSKCNEEKDLNEFSLVFPKKEDGRIRPDCKACVKLRAAIRYKSWSKDERKVKAQKDHNRAAVVNAKKYVKDYLLLHSCVDCGESDVDVLDFDHVRGIKDQEVSAMANRGYLITSIDTEIIKCDIRCSNCHRKRHAKERREKREARV
jgi:hypothetical protein